MIDNILLYIKLFPSLIKFTKQRIIDTWKRFAISFAELVLVLNNTRCRLSRLKILVKLGGYIELLL